MDNTRTEISTFSHIANANLYEVPKSNAFKLVVIGLDPLTSPITGELIPNASERLKESNFSFTPPSFSQEVNGVRVGNTVCKSAGTPTFSDATAGFHDYIGLEAYNTLYAWQSLSFNINTGRVGLMADYKKDAYVLEYTPDFSKIIRVWKLFGVWVNSLTRDGFDNSNNASEVKVNCSLAYDYAIPQDPSQF